MDAHATTTLLTVGHGRLDRASLGSLLDGAGVQSLVDVRRYPGSRANPDSRREALEEWVPEAGLAYRWVPELGGRRRLPRDRPAEDPWWQVEQFAAYAAYTRTAEFADAMRVVLDDAGHRRTAIMCSEAVWWRCHRRLIADVVTLRHDVEARHLMHDGSLRPHPISAGARRRADGLLVWDA